MKVTLKDVRLTFPRLFEPQVVNGQGEPKYSASALFSKTHPCVAEITKAIQSVAAAKWGAKAADQLKQLKAADRLPVHDGDGKADYDGYAGNLFMNCSNKVRPLVIDGNKSPLQATDGKPYSGCYANMIVEFWAQDNQFGKRVNASLLGVQFLRDGERLAGGSVAAADDFEAIPETAVAESGNGAASLF